MCISDFKGDDFIVLEGFNLIFFNKHCYPPFQFYKDQAITTAVPNNSAPWGELRMEKNRLLATKPSATKPPWCTQREIQDGEKEETGPK